MKTGIFNGNNFVNSPITIGNGDNITNVVNTCNNELDNIIERIMENLSCLKREDAENIKDVVEMAREELIKPEPRVNRLKNCLALIAPIFTIVNGVPTLASNLQRLVDYITQTSHTV